MILTCSFLMPNDEECGERCEGNTPFCGSHNRFLRKEKELAEKALAKKASLLSKPKKVYAKPNKVSDKRKSENIEYTLLRRDFLIQNPKCQIEANEYCTGEATTIHHSAGRTGEKYLDVSKWKGACMSCHVYVEAHPLEAKEKGWSESRLAKTEPHKI